MMVKLLYQININRTAPVLIIDPIDKQTRQDAQKNNE